MKETPQPRLEELVALAAFAGLGLYLLAHHEITAVLDGVAGQSLAMATALVEYVRLGLRTLLALVGAALAARAAAWLIDRHRRS